MKKKPFRVSCPICGRRLVLKADNRLPVHPPKGDPHGEDCKGSNNYVLPSFPQESDSLKSKFLNKLKNLNKTETWGLSLTVFSIIIGFYWFVSSSNDQEKINDNQIINSSLIQNVPDSVAIKIANIIDVNDVLLKEGPLHDLATLANENDELKKSANNKINSGNKILEKQGAQELQSIADKRAKAVKTLSTTAAEDYRQAGSAFLVAQNLDGALECYKKASELQPDYVVGLITLSRVALDAKDYGLASNAAKNALNAATKSDFKIADKRGALFQLAEVELATNNLTELDPITDELEILTKEGYINAEEIRESFYTLEEYGIIRAINIGGNDDTAIVAYYDGFVLTSYRFKGSNKYSTETTLEVAMSDMAKYYHSYEYMRALALKGEIHKRKKEYNVSENYLKQALRLAKYHLETLKFPGLENFVSAYLEDIAHLKEKQELFQEAKELYLESLQLREKVMTIRDTLDTKTMESEKEKKEAKLQCRRNLAHVKERIAYIDFLGNQQDSIIKTGEIISAIKMRKYVYNKTMMPNDKLKLVESFFILSNILLVNKNFEDVNKVYETMLELTSGYNKISEEYSNSKEGFALFNEFLLTDFKEIIDSYKTK